MTVFHEYMNEISKLSILLSSIVIGIEVSSEINSINKYITLISTTLISYFLLIYLTKILLTVGLEEEYWTFTIIYIVISLSIYNMTTFIKFINEGKKT